MGISNVARCTFQQISEKIRDDLYNGLIQGKGWNVIRYVLRCVSVAAQVEFEPAKCVLHGVDYSIRDRLPFGFDPCFLLSNLIYTLTHGFRANSASGSTAIIVDYRWYFRSAAYLLVSRISNLLNKRRSQ